MAYYNGFPATYQPYYTQVAPVQSQQPQTNTQVQGGGIIWVQGEQAAKSYLVAPGSTVQLWDSEEKVIYLKSADASGMPSMKILDYTIRGEEQKIPEEYATKDELKALADKIKNLRDELTGKRRKMLTEDEEDE